MARRAGSISDALLIREACRCYGATLLCDRARREAGSEDSRGAPDELGREYVK